MIARSRFAVLFFSSLLFAAGLSAQPDAPQRLAARALGNTPMVGDLQELCDGIGGRPTGSPACDRAIEWAARKFREIGVDNVSVESFRIPSLWLPGTVEASAVSPERFPLRISAAPMSPSTNGTLEARLVDAGDATPEAFEKLGGAAKGAIVLIHSHEMKSFDDLLGEYFRNAQLLEMARKYQPAALFLESTRPRLLLYRHPISLDEKFAPLPTVVVAREHAERLARLLERGEVRVRLSMANQIGGAYESRNVIGEIRGREKPEEVVLRRASRFLGPGHRRRRQRRERDDDPGCSARVQATGHPPAPYYSLRPLHRRGTGHVGIGGLRVASPGRTGQPHRRRHF